MLFTGAVLAISLLSGCGDKSGRTRIIEFSCDPELQILSYGNLDYGSLHSNGKWVTYAGDNTMFVIGSGTREYIYLYHSTDGDNLKLKIDGDLLYVNGIVRSINLDSGEGGNFLEWFERATPGKIHGVRVVYGNTPQPDFLEEEIKEFQHLIAMKSVDEESGITSLFLTEFLMIPDYTDDLESVLTADGLNDKNPKLIFFDDEEIPGAIDFQLSFFKQNPSINPDRLFTNLFPENLPVIELFPEIRALNSLTSGSALEMGFLSKFTKLEELSIDVSSITETQLDFAQLPHPDLLRSLTIFGNWNMVKNDDLLVNLKHLSPGTIPSESLESVLSQFPKLTYLNLKEIILRDLSPLRAAPKLEVLIVKFPVDPELDLSPLKDLKKLRYIGLPENTLQNEELMQRLKETCPQCYFFHSEGFCLGSGWLLLFLPMLFLILLMKRRAEKKSF